MPTHWLDAYYTCIQLFAIMKINILSAFTVKHEHEQCKHHVLHGSERELLTSLPYLFVSVCVCGGIFVSFKCTLHTLIYLSVF